MLLRRELSSLQRTILFFFPVFAFSMVESLVLFYRAFFPAETLPDFLLHFGGSSTIDLEGVLFYALCLGREC